MGLASFRRRTTKVRHMARIGGGQILCGKRHADAYFDESMVTCPLCLERLQTIRETHPVRQEMPTT